MRKILVIIGFMSIFSVTQAQYKTDVFNLSIGTSIFEANTITTSLTGGKSMFLPPIIISGQIALFPSGSYWTKLISVGGSVMYDLDMYKWTLFGVNYWDKHSNIKIGGLGTYHVTPILQDYANWGEGFDNIDIYISIYMGLNIDNYTSNHYYNIVTGAYDANYNNTSFLPYIGEILGAKYYFSDNFGVYGEVGYGGNPGYFTFGMTMDF